MATGVDILYDHYKVSNSMLQSNLKDREKFFRSLFIFEVLNIIFLYQPLEFAKIIQNSLNLSQNIKIESTSFLVTSLQIVISVAISYLLIRYFQSNIRAERQYSYISKLENGLTAKADTDIFCRESAEYSRNYPFVLNIIDIFYKFIIPLILLLLHLVKICSFLEVITHNFNIVSFIEIIIDTFLIILVIAYVCLMKRYISNSAH